MWGRGTYISLLTFAAFGLLPGSLLGGVTGARLAAMLSGLPLDPGMLPRTIVLASMVLGVLFLFAFIMAPLAAIGRAGLRDDGDRPCSCGTGEKRT